MNKILSIILIGILIISGIGASAVNTKNEIKSNDNEKSTVTHTVLAEDGTATWCPYCVYAAGALKALYAEGQLDFYYVSMVTDKNSKAMTRIKNDYNIYGYPTVYWDGGYKVDVGASSVASAKAVYTNSINICSSRDVKDVDIELTALWLGGTEMQINVKVTNYEGSKYGGTIRVYITEKVSSRGWKDNSGVLYEFPFLDWAFNEVISINAGDSWSDSMTWTGSDHGYSSITQENTMIIAAVFNDEPHQGYSKPPSQYPFNAYYVDDVVATEPIIVNNPPNQPVITGETNGKTGTAYLYTFISTDPEGDDISYYIDWGDGSMTPWTNFQSSGIQYTETHTWNTKGSYTIKCKAKDIKNLESDWGTLLLTMPRNRIINLPYLTFLKNNPNLFPILRILLNMLG